MSGTGWPLPGLNDGTVLTGLKAKPLRGGLTAGLDPGSGRRLKGPYREGTRQNQVSTDPGD